MFFFFVLFTNQSLLVSISDQIRYYTSFSSKCCDTLVFHVQKSRWGREFSYDALKWDPLNKYVLLILILIQCFYYFHTLTLALVSIFMQKYYFHVMLHALLLPKHTHTHTSVHSIAWWFYFSVFVQCRYTATDPVLCSCFVCLCVTLCVCEK